MTFSRKDLSVIEGDARVSDAHVSDVLGYKSKRHIQRQIARNIEELSSYGEVLRQTDAKPHSPVGGRPSNTYFLNEEQALLLCMFSRTERAAEARRQIIEVFLAWRRGNLVVADEAPQPSAQPDLNATMAASTARVQHSTDYLRSLYGLGELQDIASDVTHMPIWPSNRRPNWWNNQELRSFLTTAHRQMSSVRAASEGQRLFGEDCPGKSAICEYWLRLDKAKKEMVLASEHPVPASSPELARLGN